MYAYRPALHTYEWTTDTRLPLVIEHNFTGTFVFRPWWTCFSFEMPCHTAYQTRSCLCWCYKCTGPKWRTRRQTWQVVMQQSSYSGRVSQKGGGEHFLACCSDQHVKMGAQIGQRTHKPECLNVTHKPRLKLTCYLKHEMFEVNEWSGLHTMCFWLLKTPSTCVSGHISCFLFISLLSERIERTDSVPNLREREESSQDNAPLPPSCVNIIPWVLPTHIQIWHTLWCTTPVSRQNRLDGRWTACYGLIFVASCLIIPQNVQEICYIGSMSLQNKISMVVPSSLQQYTRTSSEAVTLFLTPVDAQGVVSVVRSHLFSSPHFSWWWAPYQF